MVAATRSAPEVAAMARFAAAAPNPGGNGGAGSCWCREASGQWEEGWREVEKREKGAGGWPGGGGAGGSAMAAGGG
jgi:hypothetical protein